MLDSSSRPNVQFTGELPPAWLMMILRQLAVREGDFDEKARLRATPDAIIWSPPESRA